MSKNKILLSLGTLAVAAVVVIGGTVAFYNDTETSTGNIFTAGSIDLKVDHTRQTYNGVDCQTCDVTIVSDTSNIVTAKNGVPIATTSALAVTPTSVTTQYWTASIPGATWIWATDPVLIEDVVTDVTYTFEKSFNWVGPIPSASIDFSVAADNSYQVYVNGHLVADDVNDNNFAVADTIGPSLITPWLISGDNTIKFVVKNKGVPGGSVSGNPAGLLYKLTIDGDCSDEYFQQDFQNQCKLWQEKDLGEGDHFFGFNDIKPADWGTNVISLHVYDNDAYACLITSNKDDQENSLLETEEEDGDAAGVGNPEGKGELSSFINVITWNDDGDGNLEAGEGVLGMGPLASLNSIMSMDSLNQSYLVATTTKNIGLAWCAGTISLASTTSGVVCNGDGMPNKAQSDSFSADLTAYAEQVRNNGSFKCADVQLSP